MTKLEYKQAIHEIFRNLKGIELLKELFWGELNYGRVNKSLSRHGWSKTATEVLAENPVLLATGGRLAYRRNKNWMNSIFISGSKPSPILCIDNQKASCISEPLTVNAYLF